MKTTLLDCYRIAAVVAVRRNRGLAVLHFGVAGESSARESALATDAVRYAHSIVYADVAASASNAFHRRLHDWAPTPQQVDAEYAQFLRDTGFDYERDLDRIAIASFQRGQGTTIFVVADGRFDRKKIDTYTSQFGTHESRGGREIFSVPVSGSPRKISFAFPRQNRIALTDNADCPALLAQPMKGEMRSNGARDSIAWPVRRSSP